MKLTFIFIWKEQMPTTAPVPDALQPTAPVPADIVFADIGRSLPAPPHDPRERSLVAEHGGWSVRAFAWNDPRHGYLAGRGLLHLQLWSHVQAASVLTRSGFTGGSFEVCLGGERLRACCFRGVCHILSERGVPPPCPGMVEHFQAWLVLAPSIGATAKRGDS